MPSILEAQNLQLATSTGIGPEGQITSPRFFSGFLNHPEQAARALLALANLASTSYFRRVDRQNLDPVVTSDGQCLRFESFSQCAGVYGRFDALPGSLDGEYIQRGTTNVDINQPLRSALARVRGMQPLHLAVGVEEMTVTTMGGQHREDKVTLPDRWIRSFAQAPATSRAMTLRASVSAREARRFLTALPKAQGGVCQITMHNGQLRQTRSQKETVVSVTGPGRLREILPLLRYAKNLRIYAAASDGEDQASAWEVELADARFTLMVSPSPARGFSGEGGTLSALSGATDQTEQHAEEIIDLLAWLPGSDAGVIGLALSLDAPQVEAALAYLAASGRVGFDLAEQAWFHRELPFTPKRVVKDNPRLVAARQLVTRNALRLEGNAVVVDLGDHTQQVHRTEDGVRCSCTWWQRYGSSRGPCKHVLAVQIWDKENN
ncbi:SWIM zinc finger family protein [Corynebacterium sp. A21]|uniref:SWIM zinc finger family protein n=1 Tax=Corynebacterium sp. A21 TaxID=3457318 RepID=UPI003FD52A73